jgi:hypothetical protein
LLPELVDQPGVAQGAMARADDQAVARDQAVEVVPRVLRKQLARKFDGAQHRGAKIVPRALEFVLQEAVVEARVVGDEQAARQPRQDLAATPRRRAHGHHRIADAGQALDEGRNRPGD